MIINNFYDNLNYSYFFNKFAIKSIRLILIIYSRLYLTLTVERFHFYGVRKPYS